MSISSDWNWLIWFILDQESVLKNTETACNYALESTPSHLLHRGCPGRNTEHRPLLLSPPCLPCCIWSILTNIPNDRAISALPSQVAHSVCSKGHRHNQAFGWMHNSHWIGQIFGFEYRSAATNWNIDKGSLWELNVHKRKKKRKEKKEVLKGWARATGPQGRFLSAIWWVAWLRGLAKPALTACYSSFRKRYVQTILSGSKVEFIIFYKSTVKLSNRNLTPAARVHGTLLRELDRRCFVGFLYCPIQPSDHTWVGFLDLKTLQSTEVPRVTSSAPTPIVHSPVTLSSPDLCGPK